MWEEMQHGDSVSLGLEDHGGSVLVSSDKRVRWFWPFLAVKQESLEPQRDLQIVCHSWAMVWDHYVLMDLLYWAQGVSKAAHELP